MQWLASETGEVHICGHRGHSMGAPENTLAALTAAKRLGATTCEVDCVLSRDGEAILLHDLTLDRTTDGKGLVANTDWAAIKTLDAGRWFGAAFAGEPVPSLKVAIEHALDLGLGLVVEVKECFEVEACLDRIKHVLAETDAFDIAMLISFDHAVLRRARETMPALMTEGITHARHCNIAEVARSAGLASVSIEHQMFHPDDAEALHAMGVAVRCHFDRPEWFTEYAGYGKDFLPQIGRWLEAGLIDSISGDDVAFLRTFANAHRPMLMHAH